MTILVTVVGAGAIALALGDIFVTVFHPTTRSGSLSRGVSKGLWSLFHLASRRRPTILSYAGPIAMIAIIVGWATLLTVGWALVFWPHLPEGFVLATGLDPVDHGDFLDAIYLSLTTLVTLGYGDITPRTGWIRLLAPIEALIGFALVTAAISWILSIYPVLGRRRSLAHEAYLLREAEGATRLDMLTLDPAVAEQTLTDLATQLIAVRQELSQFPITYFFRSDDPRTELCAALQTLAEIGDEAGRPDCPPSVRLRAAVLHGAVVDLAEEIGRRFLARPDAPLPDLLAAFVADHRCQSD